MKMRSTQLNCPRPHTTNGWRGPLVKGPPLCTHTTLLGVPPLVRTRTPPPLQAALAVNFLGPCAAARTRTNRFLNARCSTYMTAPHFLSLKTEKCDPTCTSPAAGRSGTHSGPGNTTRQICTLRRGGHVPKAPPVRVLTGQPLTSCVRAPPAPPALGRQGVSRRGQPVRANQFPADKEKSCKCSFLPPGSQHRDQRCR